MKKFLSMFLTLLFVLTPSGVCATETDAPVLICENIEAPALPSTYVKDDFQLMSGSRTLEDILLEAWENLETQIIVSELEIPTSQAESLQTDFWHILHDNPEYFWVSGLKGVYVTSSGYMHSLVVSYKYTDPDVIAEKKAALDSATAEILLHIDDEMTDFEKVMTVHDYMVLNYSYDTSNADVMHTIFIMTEKAGVCMGYAFAFNHLMNVLGIDCTYVSSSKMNHAWNLVKLDGEWYHIDLTFDDPLMSGENVYAQVSHEYALLSSDGIFNAESSHYDFDLGSLSADSTLYDDALWRYDAGAMVYCNSKLYWIEDLNLVDEDGNVIHSDLDGGDGMWQIASGLGLRNTAFTGLGKYGNTLYYNSDNAIYSYDTVTKKVTEIEQHIGACGIFMDKNILKYSKFNRPTQTIIYDSEIVLEKEEESVVVGSSIHAGEKIITPVYKEDDETMFVFCHSGTSNVLQKLEGTGSFAVETTAGDIFFWTDKLKPLAPKHSVN